MRNPTNDILIRHAPLEVWSAAEKQANRSVFLKFKTGAVLIDRKGNIVGKGCSHVTESASPRNSIHAENHALMSIGRVEGLMCLTVTINKSGNFAWSSKPCASCVHLMFKAGIERVIYAERSNDGEWTVNDEALESLILRVDSSMIHKMYTHQMRVS